MKKILLPITIVLICLASCHSSKNATSTSASQMANRIVAKMQTTYPGYTVTELRNGKKLYQQNCGSFHELKNPNSLSKTGWEKIVPPMCEKVNEHKKILSTTDEGLILKYLISVSTKN